ncbi:hypothetical protein COO60DRAFT_1700630 [Scenedesmus sp. NREL 46B-D3]|nr:hypothetical protein COO60DRAFT_1700630 [Scenedesmus sp. NREL 46B-D3]
MMSATSVSRVQAQQCIRVPPAPLYRLNTKTPRLRLPARGSRVLMRAGDINLLDTAVTFGALSLSVGATIYTLFNHQPHRSGPKQVALTNPDDNFTWGVMGAVSCIPLFNYTAWVLGALQSEAPRPYYWAAALYTLPLLRNGLEQDWFSWTLLLLGVVHVQALRVASTEPELQAKLQQQLKPLSLAAAVAGAAGKAAAAAVGSSSSDQQQLGPGDGSSSISEALQGKQQPGEEQEELLRRLELEEFDRKLQHKGKE